MESLEITTLSSKGQIVIPTNIRKELSVKTGSKFAILTDGDNILLKKIDLPKIDDFKDLIKRSRALINNSNIKKTDLNKILKF